MYTVIRLGRCCYAVHDTNDIEVTRFAYEADANHYAREANRQAEARRAWEADRAMVADLERDGLL